MSSYTSNKLQHVRSIDITTSAKTSISRIWNTLPTIYIKDHPATIKKKLLENSFWTILIQATPAAFLSSAHVTGAINFPA